MYAAVCHARFRPLHLFPPIHHRPSSIGSIVRSAPSSTPVKALRRVLSCRSNRRELHIFASNLSPTRFSTGFLSTVFVARVVLVSRLRIAALDRRWSARFFSRVSKKVLNIRNISVDRKIFAQLKNWDGIDRQLLVRSIITKQGQLSRGGLNAPRIIIYIPPIPQNPWSSLNFRRQTFSNGKTFSIRRSAGIGRWGEWRGEWRGGEGGRQGEVKRWNKSWHLPAFSRYERRVIRLIMGSACIHARGCAVLFYGGVGWTANDRVFTVNHDI